MYWVIYSSGQLYDTGMVKLPKSKVEKVIQICQNKECLLPNTKPLLALLSLKMYWPTGSDDVIMTLINLDTRFHTRKLYLLKAIGQIEQNHSRQ